MPEIELRVNGSPRRVQVEEQQSLLSVLRDGLQLTGSKYGCGEGMCGACTVLIDGQARRSCITLAENVKDREITTIEGLEKDGHLHPVQEAFIEASAMQCGYCIAGMIMSGAALIKKNPHPSDDEILKAMEGNMCRCGTYPRILTAMRMAGGRK
jgi:aerobic-type carbon monoxide dehydrogenase small subunit (CoxS/CutS family)